MRGAEQIIIMSPTRPSWLLAPGGIIPDVDIDFANGLAWTKAGGLVLPASLLTVTRASQETITDSAGNITYAPNGSAAAGGVGAALSNAGLQAWEARTNICLQSQALATTPWGNGGVPSTVFTNNAGVAPDGSSTATSIAPTQQYGCAYQTNMIVTSSSVYTVSFWAKWVSGNTGLTFVTTGDVSGVIASTLFTVSSVWQRFQFTVTMGASDTIAAIYIQDANASGFGSWLTWGVQFELGSFASPYIPTTSGTAARAADAIVLTTPPVFGASYSLVGWGTPSAPVSAATTQPILSYDNGTISQRAQIYRISGVDTAVLSGSGSLTNVTFGVGAAWAQSALGKIGLSFASASHYEAFGGAASAQNTSAGTVSGSQVSVGRRGDGGTQFNGTISRIALWPTTALSAGALQQVTT